MVINWSKCQHESRYVFFSPIFVGEKQENSRLIIICIFNNLNIDDTCSCLALMFLFERWLPVYIQHLHLYFIPLKSTMSHISRKKAILIPLYLSFNGHLSLCCTAKSTHFVHFYFRLHRPHVFSIFFWLVCRREEHYRHQREREEKNEEK